MVNYYKCYRTLKEIELAVCNVKEKLWHNGEFIAQCELDPGANPDNVYRVFQTWDSIT